MQLSNRQSRFVVTDYAFGDEMLLYSSAEVLTYGTFDIPVIIFYLKTGQVDEFSFKLGSVKKFKTYEVKAGFKAKSNGTITKYTYALGDGATFIQFSNSPVIYLLDLDTAYSFSPRQQFLIRTSPQRANLRFRFVRSASASNEVVRVSSDNTNQTTVEVYVGDERIKTIQWNGKLLATKKTAYDSLVASISGVASRKVELPTLTWVRMAYSTPGVARTCDDSKWTVCNKTTTLSSAKPLTPPVLFSSGYASGWSAWLNGRLAGSSPGNTLLSATWNALSFSNVTMYTKGNVLTVLADYSGYDETSVGAENPRGILGAVLYESGNSTLNFTQWKIQGNAGGSKNIDVSGSPTDGLTKLGVTWYGTTFRLDIYTDLDVPIGIELGASTTVPARVQIFVNRYQYGKFLPHTGPQTKFPVPPGIINNRGSNTLAVRLWGQTDAGAELDTVSLISYGQYETDFGFSGDWSYLQPGWTRDRLQYA